MLRGALVVIDKDKNGHRDIEGAIHRGLGLYQSHHGDIPAQELIALVNPHLFKEQNLAKRGMSMCVDQHKDVPYACLWICRKGDKR